MVHSQSQSETRGGAFASERSRWWVGVFEGGFIRVMNRQCVLRVFRRFGRLAAARFARRLGSTTTRRSTTLDSPTRRPTRRPIDRCFRVRFRRRDRGRRTSSSVGRRASSLDDDAFSREKEGAKEGRKEGCVVVERDGRVERRRRLWMTTTTAVSVAVFRSRTRWWKGGRRGTTTRDARRLRVGRRRGRGRGRERGRNDDDDDSVRRRRTRREV